MKVLIAGASGFIGKALIERLLKNEGLQIVALSRQPRSTHHPRLSWVQGDLYSMKDVADAMQGCDAAYYLVHSMLPTAALSQGTFYDFDLIMADNFSRCARQAGLGRLVYLGGMVPEDERELSWHLRSRREVEDTLQSSGVRFTALRAGLVVGAGGSSFEMLRKLVERMPWMACPPWTHTESQPIALREVVDALEQSLISEMVAPGIYDLGGPEVLSYRQLLELTAKVMGLHRRFIALQMIPLTLSRLWVSLITGAPRNLVYPLVMSLKHRMVVRSAAAWPHFSMPRIRIESALEEAMSAPMKFEYGKSHTYLDEEHEVRSVQRLPHPAGRTAEWVAEEYFRWLPKFFFFLIRVRVEGVRCKFFLLGEPFLLLHLEKSLERSSRDRQLLYVRGGLLASSRMKRGRLEFREVLNGGAIIAALHEFIPSLPWNIYRFTQAIVHLFVMNAFSKHLESLNKSSNL